MTWIEYYRIYLCHIGMTWKIFFHMYIDESHKWMKGTHSPRLPRDANIMEKKSMQLQAR
jgi:hypothetical protein